LLGRQDAIRLVDGKVSIDETVCWIDATAFELLCDLSVSASKRLNTTEAIRFAERALEIYRGLFLPQDHSEPWTVSMRERLRNRFHRLVSSTGSHYEQSGDFAAAMELFRRGIEDDNLAEEFYQGLMRCLAAEGRHAEAIAVYRQLRQILSVVLGSMPSAATQAMNRKMLEA
jgi:pentatricopeptide repeat protein